MIVLTLGEHSTTILPEPLPAVGSNRCRQTVRADAGSTSALPAELSTWYFGARGDLAMLGPKPAPGPGGLRLYDPEGYKLMDDFYSGRTQIPGP